MTYLVQHHDPSFGYNTTEGYIEEDSVQALEQIVSEKFGFGRNACEVLAGTRRGHARSRSGDLRRLQTRCVAHFRSPIHSGSHARWEMENYEERI
jgi:hypothetical protein